ncbi:MAG: hypothetical protein LC102_12065 [Ignavibacteriales bacterium]|nr:hypothetical protein [Ignavibacteriaceae bacterium]MBW7873810.1 hypothetical protein [Ignavibacteria bacterium]MBZ0196521.1 hypothetical protein [Ignavibacteriaceae bacterium]MCZ2144147.1 hypothetical protein [Ignavibacteriales bacterium]
MKRLALILVLLVIITPPHIYAQLGKTVFPKIGFADPYTVSQVPFYYGGKSDSLAWQLNNFTNNKYYFPLLKSLGLTHLVTGVDQAVTLNNEYNSDTNKLKIFDIGIEWRQPSKLMLLKQEILQ